MIGAGKPRERAGNVRDVQDPVAFGDAFSTLLRCFKGHPDADAAIVAADDAERGRIWRAIRVLRCFDAPILRLVAVASADGCGRLLVELVAAGVLIEATSEDGEWPRYSLAIDPGATCPRGVTTHA